MYTHIDTGRCFVWKMLPAGWARREAAFEGQVSSGFCCLVTWCCSDTIEACYIAANLSIYPSIHLSPCMVSVYWFAEFQCMHVCTIYVCMYACMYGCIAWRRRVRVPKNVCMNVCMHASKHTYTYSYIYLYICTYMYIFMYIYIYVYT